MSLNILDLLRKRSSFWLLLFKQMKRSFTLSRMQDSLHQAEQCRSTCQKKGRSMVDIELVNSCRKIFEFCYSPLFLKIKRTLLVVVE
jgi:hypothetical protein